MNTLNQAKFNQQEMEWERLQDKLPGGPDYDDPKEKEECPNLTICKRQSCSGCRFSL